MATASKRLDAIPGIGAIRLWHIVSVLGGVLVGIALPLILQKDSLGGKWAYIGAWGLWACGIAVIALGNRRTRDTLRGLLGVADE